MAWNEPGNGGKDRDPWGNDGKHQGPPDLDKVIRNLSGKLGGLLGGRGSGSGGGGIGSFGVTVALVIALAVWVVSGFYTIGEAQRGVVLRFGKFYQTVEPGLSWKATFIDRVYPVDVETVRSLPASGFMLTRDENLVRVEMDVQYRVIEPRDYLFNVTNADDSLHQALDSALRYVVGHSTMDDVLTVGRERVRQETRELLQQIIEPYQLGLMILDLNFLPARPPEEVKDAFDDAIAAQEDEQRFIREAEAYAREIEPKARGQAQRLLQEAEAYKQQVALRAEGEVARFRELLPQFEQQPELTRERIYLETMEEIYSKVNKVVVDTPDGNNSLMYLPLDKLMAEQSRREAQVDPNVITSDYSNSNVPSGQDSGQLRPGSDRTSIRPTSGRN
ncbi:MULTISPECIES: FtsH protease activity modulator HflK [Oceanimonas]|uniref:Protein HflK n=1 Tax=Oceanimonas doudoroffii TaxID=84158 RepID=A0A233RBG5_9GAMM|nr:MULTISPECIES: FtsH protease activity modulator HflK [Oceanimonas]NHH99535.1 Modulator of FtsH protease HflK [Oceanimonas sp. MB9]OXY80726.1 FtsH protease activity modulator HflK [Oceanimonas doudoroffii]